MSGFVVPQFAFFNNGQVAAGGSVYVYKTGTTTKVTIYSDGGLLTPITNPINLDANGQCKFFVDGTVNLRLDAYTGLAGAGSLIESVDPVYPTGASSGGGIPWVVAGGTADVITATYNPVISALTDGLTLQFRATAANATTTPTFAPNGLTAHTITQKGGTALVAGNIAANLSEYIVVYNLANTRWELLNPTPVAGSVAYTLLNTVSTTGAATVAFSNTYVTSAYNKYVVEFDSVYFPSGAQMYLQGSTNNGSSYLSANYRWGGSAVTSTGSAGTVSGFGNSTDSKFNLSLGVNGAGSASLSYSGSVKFSTPLSTTIPCRFKWEVEGGATSLSDYSGGGWNSAAGINNIQFIADSGNISGNFRLIGEN